jgi:hypothetical protein
MAVWKWAALVISVKDGMEAKGERSSVMSAYRMYFLIMGQIQGREDFEATDDLTAIRIARVLYDTCSDVCDGFDLWQGKRQLCARQPHHQKASLTELIEAHQRVAIQKEEDISQSRWMIARSRRLIEALDRAKSAASYK